MTTFIPAIIWAMIILVLSIMPGKKLPEIRWDIIAPDKFAHALVYFVLSFLIMWALHKNNQLNQKWIILAVGISSIYGILIEILQFSFFPDRYFELLDIIANIIGSLSSLLLKKIF